MSGSICRNRDRHRCRPNENQPSYRPATSVLRSKDVLSLGLNGATVSLRKHPACRCRSRVEDRQKILDLQCTRALSRHVHHADETVRIPAHMQRDLGCVSQAGCTAGQHATRVEKASQDGEQHLVPRGFRVMQLRPRTSDRRNRRHQRQTSEHAPTWKMHQRRGAESPHWRTPLKRQTRWHSYAHA
jgi:hypothetical protein